ncbi:MAG: metallophosphoesterase [Tannerellaceae bacterium]|nr:metallophosphoesterase [Tannerellaceae bacterium]MCD8263052.1 metallophosphoesterase [Tannerellaceae bacterium]
MKVFLQSIVAQLLLNPYIFWRGYQAIPPKKGWRIPFIAFFILEPALYFTGFIFRKELPDPIFIAIMYICNTWYVASLYITMALLLIEVCRQTDRWWHWFPRFINQNRKQVRLILFFTILAGVTLLMIHAYRTVKYPVVRHVYITLPKANQLHDSLTIAMMSDLHIGEVIGKRQVQRYVELTNSQHPDMIVLVGDVIDYESRHAEKAQIEEDLQKLYAPLEVYMVNGNHEYRANRMAKERWFRKTGVTLLKDSVVMPDSSFYLVGRDDLVNKKRKPLNLLLQGVDKEKPIIVLDHQPGSLAETTMNRADLGLHGHTHNGQLWPYPVLMKFIYEAPYGYYRKGDTHFYVSSGIGVAGPPYRVETRSELVMVHITFANQGD